jgi:hypothetical protein
MERKGQQYILEEIIPSFLEEVRKPQTGKNYYTLQHET